MRHSEMDAALQAVYDQIPEIPDCDGRCWVSCGAITMTVRERQRIRGAGFRITRAEQAVVSEGTFWCEALKDKRCAVYEVRPLICRLWGAIERLKCPYGCTPSGGWLSDRRVAELIEEVDRIGGVERGISTAGYSLEVVKMLHDMTVEDGKRGEKRRIEQATIPPAFRRKG